MCARFTVLSDTPIPSAIAGCVIPISRHSTIWMRSRCAGGNFQCRAVFSRRTSALLDLIICPPNQMVGSESCWARKKYCTNHTHPLSPQKSRFKRVWRRYKTRYVHPDHLGSTNVVTDESGTVVQTLDYYPYGGTRINSTTGNYSGAGRQYVNCFADQSSLDYLNARYYDSARGQFLTEDPVFWSNHQNHFDPQSLNSYSYAEDNP